MSTEVIEFPLAELELGENIRDKVDEQKAKAIALSAREHGIMVPIEVVLGPDGRKVVMDGANRVRATELLGRTTIPTVVLDRTFTDSERIERQFILNCCRSDLTPLEKAKGLERLMESTKWNQAEVARRVGMSEAAVSRSLAILKLPVDVQQQVAAGKIAESKAYQLTQVANAAEQSTLAQEVAAEGLPRDELSRRVRKSSAGAPASDAKVARVTIKRPEGRTLSVSGGELTLSSLIDCLEGVLAGAKKAHRRGVELAAFVRLANAEALVTGGTK